MRSFSAFSRTDTLVLLATCCCAGLTACSSNGTTSTSSSSSSTTSATYVYTIDGNTSAISAFPAKSNGNASPAYTLNVPANFAAEAVATDSSGQLYVAGEDVNLAPDVLVYAKGASGSATPVSTLLGGTNFVDPQSVAVDSSGKIYVLDAGIGGVSLGVSISIYSPGATGTATPVRTITDTVDNALEGIDLAVDGSGNVYVSTVNVNSDASSIVEYASTANGSATPTRTITTTQFFYGLAVDSSGNIVTDEDDLNTGLNGVIVKFGSTATGAATPTTTITGSSTGIDFGGGLRLDSTGTIFMINEIPGATTDTFNVLSFSPSASGNATPSTQFTSSALADPDALIALF